MLYNNILYVFQAAQDPFPYKIGWTRNNITLLTRFKTLQTGNHLSLTSLGWTHARREDELRLHKCLHDYKLRGEWYRKCAEMNAIVYMLIVLNTSISQILYALEDEGLAAMQDFIRQHRPWLYRDS